MKRDHKKLSRIVKRFLNLTLEMIDHKKLSKIVKKDQPLNLTLEMIDHKIQ